MPGRRGGLRPTWADPRAALPAGSWRVAPVGPPGPLFAFYRNRPLCRRLDAPLECRHLPFAAIAGALGGGAPPHPPLAFAYAGHQQGVFVDQLGDGRVALVRAWRDRLGRSWCLQVKGGGPTAFARGLDGRLGLEEGLRELLGLEALAAAGVPTARCLWFGWSDEVLARRSSRPRAALLLRVLPTPHRFGTIEWLALHRPAAARRRLIDALIRTQAPWLLSTADPLSGWFDELVRATAWLAGAWQAIGFEHGMLNTDNMSLAGVALDVTHHRVVDPQRPATDPASAERRYAFGHQIQALLWNLDRLAAALTDLIPEKTLVASLERFLPRTLAAWSTWAGITDPEAAPSRDRWSAFRDALPAVEDMAAFVADAAAEPRRLRRWFDERLVSLREAARAARPPVPPGGPEPHAPCLPSRV